LLIRIREHGGNVSGAMDDVVAAVINYNTAALTRRCTRSLVEAGVARILVLDNASAIEDFRRLAQDHAGEVAVEVIRSEINLGFAQGSNSLIDRALREPSCARVLLVNSDATVEASGLRACLEEMRAGEVDLMGGRMLKPGSDTVDSLGIALYKSLLASNRKSTGDAYLGPTGGFAVYSRRFLEEARRLHGYVFDPAYFCYAEDTDLCIRARLLDARVGYTDAVVAYHEGQGSSAGEYSDFILYHGIRNSIWMAAKSIPAAVIVTHLPWVILLHGGIVLRHTLQGRWRTLWRLYRDAFRGLPAVLRARSKIQATRRIDSRAFRAFIDRQFYETRFLEGAVRDLMPGERK
jgi:GT2 family glycosyltransferase